MTPTHPEMRAFIARIRVHDKRLGISWKEWIQIADWMDAACDRLTPERAERGEGECERCGGTGEVHGRNRYERTSYPCPKCHPAPPASGTKIGDATP